MANFDILQAEANALIAMKKIKVNDDIHEYPDLGGSLRIPLTSEDRREEFMVDITRGKIEIAKGTLQNRARQVIILLRLDYGGALHRNPDGEEIPCPHLHIYREGYGDKWAVPIPTHDFPNTHDHWQTLQDFMRYCNITDKPKITKGLFA
ncbi:hypothetical protein IIA28_12140 [candidate division KSB1 bacterium]|nr:hypothetical protein [candidate division KSB1 bacterium]